MTELKFRRAVPADYPTLETLLINAFGPITWHQVLDRKHGPLNGLDWRARWRLRVAKVFETQIVLVGERDAKIVAVATGTIDEATLCGFVDLLAVDLAVQGHGYGRMMLEGFLDHLRSLGMTSVQLECLTDNDRGNRLYAGQGWDRVASFHRYFKRL